jgi:hypothetical protein
MFAVAGSRTCGIVAIQLFVPRSALSGPLPRVSPDWALIRFSNSKHGTKAQKKHHPAPDWLIHFGQYVTKHNNSYQAFMLMGDNLAGAGSKLN